MLSSLRADKERLQVKIKPGRVSETSSDPPISTEVITVKESVFEDIPEVGSLCKKESWKIFIQIMREHSFVLDNATPVSFLHEESTFVLIITIFYKTNAKFFRAINWLTRYLF